MKKNFDMCHFCDQACVRFLVNTKICRGLCLCLNNSWSGTSTHSVKGQKVNIIQLAPCFVILVKKSIDSNHAPKRRLNVGHKDM